MKLVPFDSTSHVPAFLSNLGAMADINKEVVTTAVFPVMSIKGKVFTLVQDGVRKILTKPDEPDEVAQSIGVVFLRANMHAKTFYAKKFNDGDSDGQRPDCYSYDGLAPSPNSGNPQSKKCQICPHNQWGARVSEDGSEAKGKACQDNARIAITTPDEMRPTLIRVPPASLKELRAMLKVISSRTISINGTNTKVPYNAVVVKIGFDREAATPKLTFKPVGFVDDAMYAQISALYDDEVVRSIVGLDDMGNEPVIAAPPPSVDTDELDAALAAREATQKAKAQAQVEPKATPAPKVAKPKAEPVAAPVVDVDDDDTPAPVAAVVEKPKGGAANLLADLDDLLGNKDD